MQRRIGCSSGCRSRIPSPDLRRNCLSEAYGLEGRGKLLHTGRWQGGLATGGVAAPAAGVHPLPTVPGSVGVDGDQADILHVQAMLNLRIGFTRKFAGELQNHYICVPTIRTTQGYMMKRLHFDMDNILVDFASGIAKLDAKTASKYEGRLDDVLGIFALMEPIPGAIETVHLLAKKTMSLFFL